MVQRGGVAVVCVLDEDLVRTERQQVDESEAVDLGHGRIHHHRADHPVRSLGVQGLPDELLPAQVSCRRRPDRGRPARRRPGSRPVGELDPARRGGRDPAADEGRRGHPVGQDGSEPLGGDAAVGRRQRTAMGREGHVVAASGADQRRDQPFVTAGRCPARSDDQTWLPPALPSSTTASRISGRRRVRARATRPPASPPPRMARPTAAGQRRPRRSAAAPAGPQVVRDHELSQPPDVGREYPAPAPPGDGVDEPSESGIVAEHERVDRRPVSAQFVDLRNGRPDGRRGARPGEERVPVAQVGGRWARRR